MDPEPLGWHPALTLRSALVPHSVGGPHLRCNLIARFDAHAPHFRHQTNQTPWLSGAASKLCPFARAHAPKRPATKANQNPTFDVPYQKMYDFDRLRVHRAVARTYAAI